KFLLDFNMAYNGTDRFEAKKRFGFFPAVGAGYSISEESFFKEAFPFIQLFKLRASYGLVGSDVTSGGRYLYKQVYMDRGTNGYYVGESHTGQPYRTIYEGELGNDNVTWEKARKFDVGIDANLFGDKISFTVDYFYDYRYDQLVRKED